MSKQMVLSVEDNDADFYLIQMALNHCPTPLNVHRVTDGEEAIRFLEESAYVQHSLPDLILLDANIPRADGFDVLRFIASNLSTAGIPVVMLTSASSSRDKQKAMELGATDFITKTSDLTEVMDNLSQICERHLLPKAKKARH